MRTSRPRGKGGPLRAERPLPGRRVLEVCDSPIQGKGGFATRRIARGTRLIEYAGERIDHAEADRRYDDAAMRRHHTYLFTIDRHTVVDAAVGGNASRFINHSCEPNCDALIEGGRVFITAARDIRPGEELTYDYSVRREGGEEEEPPERYACRCGARRCRGTILSPRRAR
jgi:SET domain-containing protein